MYLLINWNAFGDILKIAVLTKADVLQIMSDADRYLYLS